MSYVDFNLQVRYYSATIIPNTIIHGNYTLPKLRITPRTYLFGVEVDVVHVLGLRQYLDIGEKLHVRLGFMFPSPPLLSPHERVGAAADTRGGEAARQRRERRQKQRLPAGWIQHAAREDTGGRRGVVRPLAQQP